MAPSINNQIMFQLMSRIYQALLSYLTPSDIALPRNQHHSVLAARCPATMPNHELLTIDPKSPSLRSLRDQLPKAKSKPETEGMDRYNDEDVAIQVEHLVASTGYKVCDIPSYPQPH
jgi:hypothetical protein